MVAHADRHLIAHDRTSFVFSCVATLPLAMTVFMSSRRSRNQKIPYTACLSCQYSSTPTVLWIAFIIPFRCLRPKPKTSASFRHPQSSNCRLPSVTSLGLLKDHPPPFEQAICPSRLPVASAFYESPLILVEAANLFIDTQPCD
jgi:hypothetical protein